MSEAAEHRPCDCAQYHARAESQPGLGTRRNGNASSDHAQDRDGPGAHDRSPVPHLIKPPSLAKFPTCDIPALGVAPLRRLQLLHQRAEVEITREKRFGATLEAVLADRDTRVAGF